MDSVFKSINELITLVHASSGYYDLYFPIVSKKSRAFVESAERRPYLAFDGSGEVDLRFTFLEIVSSIVCIRRKY